MSTIFTPAEKSAFAAVLAGPAYAAMVAAGAPYTALLAALNAPIPIANPTPQGTIPANPTLVPEALFGLLTDPSNGSALKLMSYPNLAAVLLDINQQNRSNVVGWARNLSIAGVGIITAGEATAIESTITATVPDPSWPATVPGLSVFQSQFPGVAFTQPDGEVHVGNCTPAMIAEIFS